MVDSTLVTSQTVYQALKTVIDPELHVDIVRLGLIYDVTVAPVQAAEGERWQVHVLMTLTTPGCPLAGVFDQMVKEAVCQQLPMLDINRDIEVELTFDPPWLPDMMDEETRAELGLD